MRKSAPYFLQFSPLAMFYSLWITSYFTPHINPVLLQFDGQQIGEATLKGIDISKRVAAFYRYIFLFPVVWFSVVTFLRWRIFQLPASLSALWNSLAWAGCIQIFSAYFNPNLGLTAWHILSVQLFLVLQTFIPGNKLAALSRSLVSISFGMLVAILLNWLLAVHVHTLLINSFSVCAMLLVSFLVRKLSYQELVARYHGSLPLFIGGLLPFMCTEFRYFLSVRMYTPASPAFLFIVGCLILIGWTIFRFKRSENKPSFKPLFERVLLLLLVGFGIQTYYQPYGTATTEVFEMANRMLPLQEYHFFRTVPLLEKASSHFVSDYGFGMLYNLLYGYHGLDFLIFDVFEKLIWISVTYLFLNRIFNRSVFSFYFVALFPFADALFSSYFCWIFIPLLILFDSWKHPTAKNAWGLGISLALLLPWRADIAIGIICCTAIFFGIGLLYKRWPFRFILPTFICILLLGLGLLSVCLYLQIDWVSNLRSTLDYLSSSQSYGLISMGNEQLSVWKFHHLILPLLVVLSMIISVSELVIKREFSKPFPWLAILFIGTFYLVNFQRGLIRHGFVEGTDNFLSAYALLLIPLALVFKLSLSKEVRILVFLGIAVLTQLFVRFPGREPETGLLVRGAFTLPGIQSQQAVQRFKPDSAFINQNYSEITNFLKQNLKAGETFIDLGNNPMLYYYTEKEVPAFFFQSPQNVHSISLQKDWISRLKEFKVPIVLFRHVPKSWWDETDGVPNELRQYPITEFVYKNYAPLKEVGGYEIWTKRDTLLSSDMPDFIEKRYAEEFQLGLIPEFMHTPSSTEVSAIHSKHLAGYSISTAKGYAQKPTRLTLRIQAQSKSAHACKLNFFKFGKPLGAFRFTVSPIRKNDLEFRLSIHPAWAFNVIDSLYLEMPVDSIQLNAATFAFPLD
jgi:hypothetical protein